MVWFLVSIFAQISNRIEWQSNSIFALRLRLEWKLKVFIRCMNGVRLFSEISVSANEEILPEMFDISVTTRRTKKFLKKCQISLPKGHSTDFLFSLRHQITFVRYFSPSRMQSKAGLASMRWQGDNSINNVWHFFTNLINSCCSQMEISQSAKRSRRHGGEIKSGFWCWRGNRPNGTSQLVPLWSAFQSLVKSWLFLQILFFHNILMIQSVHGQWPK